MLNIQNPLKQKSYSLLAQRCQEGDQGACRDIAQTKMGYTEAGSRFAATTVGKKGVVGMAEGGMMEEEMLLAPEGMDMAMEEEGELTDPDSLLPLMDVLGEEAFAELAQAMEKYPVVTKVAEMAVKTSDGFVDGMGGPKDDQVPARLSPGEYVFTAEAVDVIGLENLEKMHEEAQRLAASV